MLKDDDKNIRTQAANLIIEARQNEAEAVAREIEKTKGLTKNPGKLYIKIIHEKEAWLPGYSCQRDSLVNKFD